MTFFQNIKNRKTISVLSPMPRKTNVLRLVLLLLLLATSPGFPLSAATEKIYCVGTYQYDVLIDGQKSGSANVRKEIVGGNYKTYSEITFMVDGISAVTKETIIEKSDFLPVSYETDAAFISDKYVSRLKLRSWYDQDYLYLNDGRSLSKFRTGGSFHYGVNKVLSAILAQAKVEGASASCSVFDPAVETKRTLPVKGSHVGNVTVNYRGKIVEAYRLLVDYGSLKKVEMTVDKKGIIYAYVYTVNGVATEMRLVSNAK